MLINIGPPKEPSDLVDLMQECHERIRSFIGLAGRLANAGNPTHNEIRDAAARVARYFSEALPLHVADEEESIVPRLTGKSPQVEAALQEMHAQHLEHEASVRLLLETCGILKQSPERLDEVRETLLKTASTLETEFAAHLKSEEDMIFPAIRSLLTAEQQSMILTELRERRNSAA
jgi:iron-sulfur cluster repair protein YtfE (RIC family)